MELIAGQEDAAVVAVIDRSAVWRTGRRFERRRLSTWRRSDIGRTSEISLTIFHHFPHRKDSSSSANVPDIKCTETRNNFLPSPEDGDTSGAQVTSTTDQKQLSDGAKEPSTFFARVCVCVCVCVTIRFHFVALATFLASGYGTIHSNGEWPTRTWQVGGAGGWLTGTRKFYFSFIFFYTHRYAIITSFFLEKNAVNK